MWQGSVPGVSNMRPPPPALGCHGAPAAILVRAKNPCWGWWVATEGGGGPGSMRACHARTFRPRGGSDRRGHEATDTGHAYAPVSQAHGHHHIVQCFSLLHSSADQDRRGGGGGTAGWGGHEATDTGLAYAPVSQAHGHNHIVQCFSRCTAAQTSSVPHQVVADCALALILWTLRSARTHHPPTVPASL